MLIDLRIREFEDLKIKAGSNIGNLNLMKRAISFQSASRSEVDLFYS